MTRPSDAPTVVLDIGATNLKILLIDGEGSVVHSVSRANAPLNGPPYQHLDPEPIWQWILDSLTALARDTPIGAIVPCSHGSSGVLVDTSTGRPVMPIMAYEADPPNAIKDAYTWLAPPFEEVWAPTNPAGLTLARQILWQETMDPAAFSRADVLLTYPQYWAWRLTGVLASEVTSLGAQTHLWAPRHGDFSSLVASRDWRRLFPERRNAWDALGPPRPDICQRTGLSADTPVLCGIHDSNANYLRYLQSGHDAFTLMSTGTWLITFNRSGRLEAMDPARDTATNCDIYGRPVACSRFMAGREFSLLCGDTPADTTFSIGDIERVIHRGTLALPSYTDSGGPFPETGGMGRIEGPEPETAGETVALATLYCALMSNQALEAVGTEGDLIIDGPFTRNPHYAALVAALRPDRRVWLSPNPNGTALGAAILRNLHDGTAPASPVLEPVEPAAVAGLDSHARAWLARTLDIRP